MLARCFFTSLIAGAAILATSLHADETAFDFDTLVEKARQLAKEEYTSPAPIAEPLQKLDYDTYRKIKSADAENLWGKTDSPFHIQFFHPGYRFLKPVRINLVSQEGKTSPLPFSRKYFDYQDIKELGETEFHAEGFAGFKIFHPLNGGKHEFNEIGSFLGASYFRLLGKDQRYGISARGLAINPTSLGPTEEFPYFTEYWLVEPKAGDTSLTIYALLESPSVTGAYHFTIHPGETTRADINVSLFFRKENPYIGIAPLTSMFWYGENHSERTFPDWRPEVHDSDGLLLQYSGGKTIWRPLYNHHAIRTALFNGEDLSGFGLLQRDRDFNNYQDLGNPQHYAPSTWVTPGGKWPAGKVKLVELPTNNEAMDNVVSYYELTTPPKAGDSLQYSYTLAWEMLHEKKLSPNQAIATRIEKLPKTEHIRRFVIDFSGPDLNKMDSPEEIRAELSSSANTKITEQQCFKNPHTGGWRVAFKIDLSNNPTQPTNLHCLLRLSRDNTPISELWSYQWTP